MPELTADELRRASEAMRRVLDGFDSTDDTPADRVTRRHIEGAVSAAEVVTGRT